MTKETHEHGKWYVGAGNMVCGKAADGKDMNNGMCLVRASDVMRDQKARIADLESALRAVQSDRGAGHLSDGTIHTIDRALIGADGSPGNRGDAGLTPARAR